MIIDDLTRDDIIYVIEHIHDFCACREDCINCPLFRLHMRMNSPGHSSRVEAGGNQ